MPPTQEPKHCHQCGSDNLVFWEAYKKFTARWKCDDCGASVGCRQGTRIPLGYMANDRIKDLRQEAHAAFDPIWKRKKIMPRDDAYIWLSQQLSIDYDKCHIAMMDEDQLTAAIQLCLKFVADWPKIKARREEKKNAKPIKYVPKPAYKRGVLKR